MVAEVCDFGHFLYFFIKKLPNGFFLILFIKKSGRNTQFYYKIWANIMRFSSFFIKNKCLKSYVSAFFIEIVTRSTISVLFFFIYIKPESSSSQIGFSYFEFRP